MSYSLSERNKSTLVGVTVRCASLAAKASSPYVEIRVHYEASGNEDTITKRTSVVRASQTPEWNQHFWFPLPHGVALPTSLECTIRTHYRIYRDVVVGRVTVPAGAIPPDGTEVSLPMYPLDEKAGTLSLTLCCVGDDFRPSHKEKEYGFVTLSIHRAIEQHLSSEPAHSLPDVHTGLTSPVTSPPLSPRSTTPAPGADAASLVASRTHTPSPLPAPDGSKAPRAGPTGKRHPLPPLPPSSVPARSSGTPSPAPAAAPDAPVPPPSVSPPLRGPKGMHDHPRISLDALDRSGRSEKSDRSERSERSDVLSASEASVPSGEDGVVAPGAAAAVEMPAKPPDMCAGVDVPADHGAAIRERFMEARGPIGALRAESGMRSVSTPASDSGFSEVSASVGGESDVEARPAATKSGGWSFGRWRTRGKPAAAAAPVVRPLYAAVQFGDREYLLASHLPHRHHNHGHGTTSDRGRAAGAPPPPAPHAEDDGFVMVEGENPRAEAGGRRRARSVGRSSSGEGEGDDDAAAGAAAGMEKQNWKKEVHLWVTESTLRYRVFVRIYDRWTMRPKELKGVFYLDVEQLIGEASKSLTYPLHVDQKFDSRKRVLEDKNIALALAPLPPSEQQDARPISRPTSRPPSPGPAEARTPLGSEARTPLGAGSLGEFLATEAEGGAPDATPADSAGSIGPVSERASTPGGAGSEAAARGMRRSHSVGRIDKDAAGGYVMEASFRPFDKLVRDLWQRLFHLYDTDEIDGLTEVDFALMMANLGSSLTAEEVGTLFVSAAGAADAQLTFDVWHPFVIKHIMGGGSLGITKCPVTGTDLGSLSGLHALGAIAQVVETARHDGRSALDTDAMLFAPGYLTVHAPARMVGESEELDFSNLAEIYIQDRLTGLVLREHIPAYIKQAMRVLYRSRLGRITARTSRAKALLARMTIRAGLVKDSPRSKADIPAFITEHNIDVSEIELPISEYPTFNAFFYRHLKPGARPITAPEDPAVAITPCDCRLLVFQSLAHATSLWIKGSNFSLAAVVNNDRALIDMFDRSSLVVCRLAPQDYHRVHVPVDCTVERAESIAGAYYTVSPLAIRRDVDVFTSNRRVVVLLNTPGFGHVLMVLVGATLVGSCELCVEVGKSYRKGDDFGYFAFGGSTVIIFFQQGRIRFADDLVANSRKPLETLVRLGMLLGDGPDRKS